MRDGTEISRARPIVLSTLAGALLAAVLTVAPGGEAVAQTNTQRLKLLEQTVKELLARDEARERKMKAMEGELERLRRLRGLATVSPRDKPAPQDSGSKADGHGHGMNPAAGKEEMRGGKKAGHGHGHGDETGADSAEKAGGHEPAGVWSARVGDGVLRLTRIGMDMDFAAGAGTAEGEEVEALFGGHHDPKGTGFTLQSADLSISGSYDPYFDAFFNVAFTLDAAGETGLEIEEAWIRSKWLGDGSVRLTAGQFLTAFGVVNRSHLHDWAWQTQPVIATRVFGGDGARGLGVEAEARLSNNGAWRSSLFVSMQNRRAAHAHRHGEEEAGHEEEEVENGDEHEEEVHADEDGAGVDGLEDFAYAIRLENRLTLSPRSSLTFGGSAMFEPNPNGDGSRVSIFGADLKVSHRLPSNDRLVLSAEFMHRNSRAAVEEEHGAEEEEEEEEHAEELFRLRDFGFYVQGMYYGTDGWGLGLRYEYAGSRGGGDADARAADPMRGKRTRISPLLYWQFSELGRLKVQYNYDRADFLEDRIAHSLYLSASWSFGLGAPDDAGHGH